MLFGPNVHIGTSGLTTRTLIAGICIGVVGSTEGLGYFGGSMREVYFRERRSGSSAAAFWLASNLASLVGERARTDPRSPNARGDGVAL